MQQKRAGLLSSPSSNSTMARVLLLAASAVALRPTLPKRSRIATRRTMTMHDYDYDVIIVGCGVGGHGAALHARSQGLKTCVLSGRRRRRDLCQ